MQRLNSLETGSRDMLNGVAAQPAHERDLANRRAFRVSHSHWGRLAGEGAHTAPAKRVMRTVGLLLKTKRLRSYSK